ncbi:LPS export ABC transporter permease LptG [uncultured Desulfobacter sp.]|uniref:LPS export ABC transporter permease LptG n=1 Tax=uncultured Desulfobacter sp. TaxID=240139 RepID=UPI002AAAF095|nr:LPS export ABC transporter permease LptG [uncultured Desulfobacter sp.]
MISCLHRYWFKEFARIFIVIQALILVLFVFIDYLSHMNRILEHDVGFARGLWYVLLKLPYMFAQFTPAGLLLAVICVFGIMNRAGELTALKSSGISVYFLVKPAILAGVGLALLMILLTETLIPVSMARSNHIRYNEMSSSGGVVHARKDIWIRSDNMLAHINFFDPAQKTVAGVTCTTMDAGFKISSRIDAAKGYYDNGQWILEDVLEQVYDPEIGDYHVVIRPKQAISLALKPDDLVRMAQKTNEMSYTELRRYVAKVTAEGYDATTYKVDMYGKLAFPFICVIMALTGAATGMRGFVKNNLPVGIAVGVGFCFLYWFVFGFTASLGYAKMLPPMLAVWVSNLVFLCLGCIYLIQTE